MIAAEFTRLARNPLERLFDALIDSTRCDRAMLLLLTGYAATCIPPPSTVLRDAAWG